MGASGSLAKGNPVLILFDGVCNLCSGVVQFLIKHDPDAHFRFASLQSEFGKSQLRKFNFEPDALHSVVVIQHDAAFQKSDAVLYIIRHLSYPWRFLTLLGWLPKRFRDAGYDLIARSRYKIFGRTENCMVPNANLRERYVG